MKNSDYFFWVAHSHSSISSGEARECNITGTFISIYINAVFSTGQLQTHFCI